MTSYCFVILCLCSSSVIAYSFNNLLAYDKNNATQEKEQKIKMKNISSGNPTSLLQVFTDIRKGDKVVDKVNNASARAPV